MNRRAPSSSRLATPRSAANLSAISRYLKPGQLPTASCHRNAGWPAVARQRIASRHRPAWRTTCPTHPWATRLRTPPLLQRLRSASSARRRRRGKTNNSTPAPLDPGHPSQLVHSLTVQGAAAEIRQDASRERAGRRKDVATSTPRRVRPRARANRPSEHAGPLPNMSIARSGASSV